MKRPILSLLASVCLMAGLFCGLSAPSARAQEFNDVQTAIKPQINNERARYFRRLVRDIARQRFIDNSGQIQVPATVSSSAAGLTPGGSQEIASLSERMEPGSRALELSMALVGEASTLAGDDAYPAGLPSGSFWVDYGEGELEDTNPISGYDGTQTVMSGGFDLEIGDRLLLGLIINRSQSDVDNIFLPGNSSTETASHGVYGALFLADTLILSFSALHNSTRNKARSFGVTADYDSTGWTTTASVTKYFVGEDWQVAPSVGVSIDRDEDEAYTDIAGTRYRSEVTRSGIVTAGISASRSVDLGNGMALQGTLSAEGEYEFYKLTAEGAAFTANDERYDATVGAGLDFTISENLSFSLEATMSGLLKETYRSQLVSGRMTISF